MGSGFGGWLRQKHDRILQRCPHQQQSRSYGKIFGDLFSFMAFILVHDFCQLMFTEPLPKYQWTE